MNGPECRWCGERTEAEFVDVGLGWMQQVTGGMCHRCGGYENGHYQNDGRLSEVEFATYWSGPFEDYADFSPFNHMREGDSP
ncbi:hypothetical protein QE345_gp050 [Pseudomonas phage vB_PA45_GUMS]|uniref:Uncharacterized protein n=1 Tax=Pseudomonas phage vB_PA45_GUMS TaxID=2656517 RepID=A0A8T8BGD1_9CAUD|nr:hypothetical protein QE345_gp050 [Pseudomonas phage vB_PA45_GUMS]QGK90339.1 hypothetical protein [Pseudomonas phage vB_PA45_GUMS]